MSEIETRLQHLRERMARAGISALVIPRADEYLGEYLPEFNERLRWATGFTGSAGMAIVLRDGAAVFVDGRYTEQVRQQVPGDLFEYRHIQEQPPADWLGERLQDGDRVGYDPRLHSLRWQRRTGDSLARHGIDLVALDDNPVDACWQDRPPRRAQPMMLLDERFTGRSSIDKRRDIGAAIAGQGADAALIFAPDSVSWLLNVRGRDIPALPVVLGFALLEADGAVTAFLDPETVPGGFDEHVGPGVRVLPETAAAETFASWRGRRVLADPDTANAWSQLALESAGAELIAAPDPVLLPKACKNEVEREGMRRAHLRDGVAEVRFLAWLDAQTAAGRRQDEAELADRLYEFRRAQEHFQDVSFATISAAGPNAAMAHYNHRNGVPAPLPANGVYLVDSGGQYLDGTTDITRTIAVGDPGPEVRRLFTLVLKGHIALDRARFPRGTTGTQLDVLARQYLWQQGFDYDHGTGHGVGCFLSVHEGPQRIAKVANDTALQPGMVLSNEPGYYRSGAFGIRCENLVMVTEIADPDSERPMLGFEVLTLAPFDLRLVDATLLTADEIAWLNDYHRRVREQIGPLLDDGAERAWLEQATRELAA
jgi:Xaa-Pro aminopeptidase